MLHGGRYTGHGAIIRTLHGWRYSDPTRVALLFTTHVTLVALHGLDAIIRTLHGWRYSDPKQVRWKPTGDARGDKEHPERMRPTKAYIQPQLNTNALQ
jgi:hypothetical protein